MKRRRTPTSRAGKTRGRTADDRPPADQRRPPHGSVMGCGRTAEVGEPPNKGMKLTKLSAAPTLAPESALARRRRRMPAPPHSYAGTASQLIPGVRRT
jgi:hypothetical protein